MDPAVLAGYATSALAPHLPTLLSKVGEGAATETGKQSLGAVWNGISSLWSRLRPAVEESPTAIIAAERLASNNEDDLLRVSFRVELRVLLTSDEDLRSEVEKLVDELRAAARDHGVYVTVFGKRAVGLGGDNFGTISTGDVTNSE